MMKGVVRPHKNAWRKHAWKPSDMGSFTGCVFFQNIISFDKHLHLCVFSFFFQQTHHTWSAPYGILWSGSQNLRRTSTSTCISQSRRPSTVSHISLIIPHMFFHRNLWPYYAVDNSFTSPQPLHRPKSIDGRDQNPVPGNWAMKNTTFSHLIILAAK